MPTADSATHPYPQRANRKDEKQHGNAIKWNLGGVSGKSEVQLRVR